jgi:siroheme synthase (precorrin-2 oxidase/ferrochelatase)
VANQKVDQGLQKGIGAMQDMVKQLMETVQQQSQQTDKMMQALTKALTAPRVKKAIRGKDGRLEAVEEQVA